MSVLSIQPPYPIFTESDGLPLENGYVWIGQANQNPITNPINVYWDAGFTQPAVQPIRTLGGYPVNAGTPARLYVDSNYSIQVKNKNGTTIYSALSATERYSDVVLGPISAADMDFIQSGVGAVTRTALSKMREVFTPQDFGAVANGVANTALEIANAFAANPNGEIFFPAGDYLISSNLTVPSTNSIRFERGAKFIIPSGVTLTYNGKVFAGDYQLFDIATNATLTGLKEAPVEWFGGGTSVANNTTFVQKMLNNGVRIILYGPGEYVHTSTIQIPQGVDIVVKGAGFRQTIVSNNNSSGIPLFNYQRTAGTVGSTSVFEELVFVWRGTPRLVNSCAISYFGLSDGIDDNWLRVYKCMFYFFQNAIVTKWTGQNYYRDNFYQANGCSHQMQRGSSFFYMLGEMSFDERYIFAEDPIRDAYSNGLIIENCNNITAAESNIFIDGWQAVYISKSGWDLGFGGDAALWFRFCQDVTVESCFVSSDGVAARDGIRFEATHTYVVHACTIVNNLVGIRCTEPPLSFAAKAVIDSNKFGGNQTNDVLVFDNCEAIKIINNHFEKQMSRTGTNFEIYANTPGTDNLIITQNTFFGTSYSILCGPNSIVANNLFGVKF